VLGYEEYLMDLQAQSDTLQPFRSLPRGRGRHRRGCREVPPNPEEAPQQRPVRFGRAADAGAEIQRAFRFEEKGASDGSLPGAISIEVGCGS
jgi:hypothetical protein